LGEFSITHWLILGMVLLLLFGAKRIPEVGSSLGKGIREFKRSLSDVGDAVNDKETRALPPTSGAASTRDNNPPKRLLE
jgi:sec-independent protein translocase protein TatA